MKSLFQTLIFSTLTLAASSSLACDLCGCALINHPWEPRSGLYFAATEQFTRFKTLQVEGHKIDNPADQFLDSSNTQILLGYNFSPRAGIQLNVPLIERNFRRPADGVIEKDDEGGLGDVSLLASFIPFYHNSTDLTVMARIVGGIKFPTGNSDRIGEEAEEGDEEVDSEAEPERHRAHLGIEHGVPSSEAAETLPESGIHGHDLALGSGSLDGVIGGTIYARFKRVYLSGDLQYAIRQEGDFDYRYANDLTWSGGFGLYLKDDRDLTLSIQIVCSGEAKGKDRFQGVAADDTALTVVYLGPKLSGTFRDRISADVQLDIPISRENSSLQIVPDYRVRAGLSVQF